MADVRDNPENLKLLDKWLKSYRPQELFDASGRLVKTTDPDGTSTRTVYDALGRQAESYDKLSRRTSYEYDLMGRLSGTRYPDGSSETHEYDAEGRRTSSTDRGGRTTRSTSAPISTRCRWCSTSSCTSSTT